VVYTCKPLDSDRLLLHYCNKFARSHVQSYMNNAVIDFLDKRVPNVISALVNSEVREKGKREVGKSPINFFFFCQVLKVPSSY
jgi:hypothetical protein